MTPIVKHGKRASQINVSPIYNDTDINIKCARNDNVLLIQNDQLVAVLTFPIMKVVRGIRMMYPNVKLNMI
jgi:hypothetical protein